MQPSYYLKAYPCDNSPDHRLLFSLKNASVIRVKESFCQALQNGSLPTEQVKTLAKLGMVVDDPDEEKRSVLGFFERLNARNTELKIIAVMNLDCNFACVYCYEGNAKGSLYMTPQTADRLMQFIRANFTEEKKHLHIDFYGGEPLLSLDLIQRISKTAKAFTDSKGASYRFNLVTNGSLFKRRVAEELSDLGLDRVRITLDGPAETHNRSRPFKSGAGSFEAVINNIRETWDLARIGIGGNFEKHNYQSFVKLLDYLVDTGLTPNKIGAIKFDPVMAPPEGDIALPEFHGGCASINEPWVREAESFLRGEILKRGYMTQKVRPVTCMVDVKDSYVVNYDGVIYKCPAFIGKEEFAAGNLETGIAEYSAAYKPEYWKNDRCADCCYLPLCFGGCRYMSYVRNGRIEDVDCRKEYLDSALENLVKKDARYLKSNNRPSISQK